jgi:hypothetical protein
VRREARKERRRRDKEREEREDEKKIGRREKKRRRGEKEKKENQRQGIEKRQEIEKELGLLSLFLSYQLLLSSPCGVHERTSSTSDGTSGLQDTLSNVLLAELVLMTSSLVIGTSKALFLLSLLLFFSSLFSCFCLSSLSLSLSPSLPFPSLLSLLFSSPTSGRPAREGAFMIRL